MALGHIHKPQDLNENAHPPVIYPGSIERVDFGEVEDDKFFIVADVQRGQTRVEWRKLTGIRPFIDRQITLKSKEDLNERLRKALPAQAKLEDAIVRLTVEYPHEWEQLIDDAALREYCSKTFEFHLVKRPEIEGRVRLPGDQSMGSLSPLELLEIYWRASHTDQAEMEALKRLATTVIEDVQREAFTV